MAQDWDNQTKLENFGMDDANTVELAEAFKEKQIGRFESLEFEETVNITTEEIQEAAKEAIESLDEEELTSFIEKSLKVDGDGDNGGKEWLTYSEMRNNNFYPFMVQAAIDLLSDKLKDEDGNENKYNDGWEIDTTEKWRALDQYISDCGWIDNIYWPWTRKVVTMVQKILKIRDDGLAWPQFFAKICSVLKGEENVSDFKVHWYNDERPYPYRFDEEIAEHNQKIEADNKRKEKIIQDGKLVELSENIDRSYFWIPEDVKIYTRDNYDWYYYFTDNKIIFVPNLESSNNTVYLQEADISSSETFPSNSSWEKVYPNDCSNFYDKLNSILSSALSSLGIKSDTYSLDFDNTSWKYVLNSYWYSVPILLSIITDWWIYSNDLWNNLKILNLCNYLLSKKYKGTFSFSADWKKLLLDGNEMNDILAFDSNSNCYKELDAAQQSEFINYLNNVLYS